MINMCGVFKNTNPSSYNWFNTVVLPISLLWGKMKTGLYRESL